jgi:hypothetical protein
MSKAKPDTRPVDRSSVTGRFVTEQFAKSHPRTTEHQRVPVPKPPKGK